MENGQTPIIQQTDSIKLVKNAKGKYQWEIKILNLDLEQLAKINRELERGYGNGNDNRNDNKEGS